MEISPGGLERDDVVELLTQHLRDMHATSPPGSVHALDLGGLSAPHVTFVTARESGALVGCGALAELRGGDGSPYGELKSMRTTAAARGRGVATAVLSWLLSEARDRGYDRVCLETGVQPYFAAAHRLYLRHGFLDRGPFGDYGADPNSRFMTLAL